MKILESVAKHNWDFIFYKTDQGFVINVGFYASAFDYTRSFKLSNEEGSLDFEGLKQLSQRIRDDYEHFKDREVTPTVRT